MVDGAVLFQRELSIESFERTKRSGARRSERLSPDKRADAIDRSGKYRSFAKDHCRGIVHAPVTGPASVGARKKQSIPVMAT
jgi:hypothetical protein